MIVIGERLNSTRKKVFEAFEKKDHSFLIKESAVQEKAGASFLDLNTAALLNREIELLRWAIPIIQKNVNIPLSIDTPDPAAMETGLKLHKGQAVMNSISGETQKLGAFLPLIQKFKSKVIVLCMDDTGLPKKPQDEVNVAIKVVDHLVDKGIPSHDIFLDPLVRAIGADQEAGCFFLEALEKIKKVLPDIKTIAGISNISFGLPRRSVLNQALLTLAQEKGLDAAIMDPTDKRMMQSLKASQAILGQDPNLREYLSSVKSGSI